MSLTLVGGHHSNDGLRLSVYAKRRAFGIVDSAVRDWYEAGRPTNAIWQAETGWVHFETEEQAHAALLDAMAAEPANRDAAPSNGQE